MEDKKVTEEGIKNVLEGLANSIENKHISEFDENFPKVRSWIEKYIKNSPYDIADHLNGVRLEFKIGSKQLLPELKTGDNKKNNYVINGIFDGTFLNALELKCSNYTDMVRKFFKAVYHQLTTNEVVNVYKEYTKEEITKWYNESSWAKKDYASLEECLNAYVGKPDMSLEEFKTSQDIIDWYYNITNLYRKMCKVDLSKLLKEVISIE